jgi:hypothetical protein
MVRSTNVERSFKSYRIAQYFDTDTICITEAMLLITATTLADYFGLSPSLQALFHE